MQAEQTENSSSKANQAKDNSAQGNSVINTFDPDIKKQPSRKYSGEADISNSLVVKGGNLFMLLDTQGDADIDVNAAHGLYFHDCRFMSKFNLKLGKHTLIPLLHTDAQDEVAEFELVNPALALQEAPGVNPNQPANQRGSHANSDNEQNHEHIPAQSIGVSRRIELNDKLQQTIRIQNFNQKRVEIELLLEFDSDFLDIFTIRGTQGGKRGEYLRPSFENNLLKLDYKGADNHLRSTSISFDTDPTLVEADKGRATYHLILDKQETWESVLTITLEDKPLSQDARQGQAVIVNHNAPVKTGPLETEPAQPLISTRKAHRHAVKNKAMALIPPDSGTSVSSFADLSDTPVCIETSNELFNRVLERCFSDLRMLLTSQRSDIFFAAGVPWYVTLFGRDSLITAIENITYNSGVAAGTLRLLASYQGTHDDSWRDEQPGKILHELRVGEKANLREVPFTPYYGTVDSTPLFLILMGDYLRWTGDYALFKELQSHIEKALEWVDKNGDRDANGFLVYGSRDEKNLANQGWKDSGNSIVNSDGSLAKPPIALVEVQGYVYKAKTLLAPAFAAIGDTERGQRLQKEADDLKRLFNQKYWQSDMNCYALALQRDEQPAKVIASNQGQTLWTGIVPPERAQAVRDHLMKPEMFNGWGIRTLSAAEKAYNPFDYQVGSIWPHDNAIIAAGLKYYGFRDEAAAIMTGLYNAATLLPNYRLPEVFAGVARDAEHSPVKYPVACRPQAWAAGAIPFLLSKLLGLEPNVAAKTLHVIKPQLPSWVERVTLTNIKVGNKSASLEFVQNNKRTDVKVLDHDTNLTVEIEY